MQVEPPLESGGFCKVQSSTSFTLQSHELPVDRYVAAFYRPCSQSGRNSTDPQKGCATTLTRTEPLPFIYEGPQRCKAEDIPYLNVNYVLCDGLGSHRRLPLSATSTASAMSIEMRINVTYTCPNVSTSRYATDPRLLQTTWIKEFRNSRWFCRGWTLQELIAPASVKFFSREGDQQDSKGSLEQDIHETTGIAVKALRGGSLLDFTVKERLF